MKPEEIERDLVKELSKLNLDERKKFDVSGQIENRENEFAWISLPKQNAFIQMAILHHT